MKCRTLPASYSSAAILIRYSKKGFGSPLMSLLLVPRTTATSLAGSEEGSEKTLSRVLQTTQRFEPSKRKSNTAAVQTPTLPIFLKVIDRIRLKQSQR